MCPHPSAPLGDSCPAIPTPEAEPGVQHRADSPCVPILGVLCFGHSRKGGEEAGDLSVTAN